MAQAIARSGARQPAQSSRCAHCGSPFHCGIDDAGGCWCAKLPPLPREAYAEAAGCLCEKCLREALSGSLGP